VIAITGSQSGKTDGILLNIIGHRLQDNPTPTLLYMPTEAAARSLAKDRLAKMFQNSEQLTHALDKKGNTTLEMFINGVRLGIAWGGSATQVSSHPAGLVAFDEIDRLKDIPGEGSAWELTSIRGASYPDFTQIGTTTVTIGRVNEYIHPQTGLIHWERSLQLESLGWSLWQDGTKHEYMIPCINCQTYFTPKAKLLIYDDTQTTNQIEKEAGLRCPHCQGFIPQKYQHQLCIEQGRLIAPGQWIEKGKVQGKVKNNNCYSAFVNGLSSDFVSWGARAVDLHRAKQTDKAGRIQAVYNTRFGELYSIQGTAPKWQELQKLRGQHLIGDIPLNVKILNIAVDVQKKCLVFILAGWGFNHKQDLYICDYGEIIGDTRQEEVWEELDQLLQLKYDNIPISYCVIDSSYNPSADYKKHKKHIPEKNINIIYDFGRRNRQKVLLVKGSPRPMDKLYSYNFIDTNHRGKTLKSGVGLYTINTDNYKQELYGWYDRGIENPELDRKIIFPKDTDPEFFKQISAEERRYTGTKIVWALIYRDNHFLDCLMMHLFLNDAKKIKAKLKTMPEINRNTEQLHENKQENNKNKPKVIYSGQDNDDYLY